ncbi:two-component sensor histidine kinase [Palleronia aestuarii]|uniref:histidine kinase n=1 Tax=Palleronia aestuarii TaxID=568105 RepID=A0A2W7QAW5_9RHOB|nr:sensor histidine kinase [Palleronia aestuarii]PZX18899.1 two-component sensor histidine kinase [Palleronia aestuarii]
MLPGGRGIDGLDRLDVRLVALLGLALLPIGIIAMVQTYRVIDEADSNAEAALAGMTISAANSEREDILRIRGAARVTAALVPLLLDDLPGCSRHVEQFVNSNDAVSFGGYVDQEGILLCGSAAVGEDFSEAQLHIEQSGLDTGLIVAVPGTISKRNVVAVTQPVYIDGVRQGYVVFSIPQEPLEVQRATENSPLPLVTLTYNDQGDLLSEWTSDPDIDIAGSMPNALSLAELTTSSQASFEVRANDGERRFYTIAPLIPGEIFAMSIWRPSAVRTGGLTAASALLFPLLMWLVSIGVAYFAVHRLVVRHIRLLRQRIRAFTMNRRILAPDGDGDIPSELREVSDAFHLLTERIVRDEADLENSIHEKDVLLKEVHHRVKNNLQLISSMINMQVRKSPAPETRAILKRMQERVMGLATIHRNLYQASVLSRVDSERLIADLIEHVIRTSDLEDRGVKLEVDVEPVILYPDQAVPLSLLVTETITNAIKYVGTPPDGPPWIKLSLRYEESGNVVLRVVNSTQTPMQEIERGESSGLGTQLMGAFVLQLDAVARIGPQDDSFVVEVEFQPSDFGEAA